MTTFSSGRLFVCQVHIQIRLMQVPPQITVCVCVSVCIWLVLTAAVSADDVKRDSQFWEMSGSCAEDAGSNGTGSNVFLDGSVSATMSLLSWSSVVIPGDLLPPPTPTLPATPPCWSDTQSPGSVDPPSPWRFGQNMSQEHGQIQIMRPFVMWTWDAAFQ